MVKDMFMWILVLCFVYGYYLIFFSHGYLDGDGNPISKKDWMKLREQDKKYH